MQPIDELEDAGLAKAPIHGLSQQLTGFVERREIPGFVLMVARSGQVVYQVAAGWRDLDAHEPMAIDTIFRIYSMSKPVCAAAVMVLVDQGALKLDDPIANVLPELVGLKVFAGLDAQGGVRTETVHRAPMVSDLLTQTAGFAYGLGLPTDDAVDSLYRPARVLSAGSSNDMIARLSSLPLAQQPGARWRYGLGADILGAMIERVTGESLSNFMARSLFRPLGMADTAFHLTESQRPRLAEAYRMSKTGLTRTPHLFPLYDQPPKLASAGAGLFSTAPDYARFSLMLLGGGELGGVRVISRAAARLQMSNHLSDAVLQHEVRMGHQRIGLGSGYGFQGSVIHDPATANLPVGPNTYQWDGAFSTWFWVDPANDIACVGMIQRGPSDGPPLQRMAQEAVSRAVPPRR